MEGQEMRFVAMVLLFGCVAAEIRSSVLMNKLSKVKPVGSPLGNKFLPLTELPPPRNPQLSGRRHLEDCTHKYEGHQAEEGVKVIIDGADYLEGFAKTVATVIIPDHIDRKHFEVTTQVPYLTLGIIEALGYHPTTKPGDHPAECEKIYQDHMDDQYSDMDMDYSEESLEMVRAPLFPADVPSASKEARLYEQYQDNDFDK